MLRMSRSISSMIYQHILLGADQDELLHGNLGCREKTWLCCMLTTKEYTSQQACVPVKSGQYLCYSFSGKHQIFYIM